MSRFELETADASGEVGTRLVANGGLVSTIEDAVRQPGTTVVVRSLFFNTPARRKFLRSARSETRAAVEAVTALALALPQLGVSMLADGKQVIEALPAPSLAERVAQLLGRRFAATLLPVAHEAGGVRIAGLVQRPAEATPTGRAAYLFVNGRPFRDPFLVRAAERGYRATVPSGSRPSVILVLDVPAADVDVNVHPAKLEVRFRDRYGLEAAVEDAVHRALGELVSAAPLGGAGSGPMPWEHQAVSASWPRAGSAPALPGLGFGEDGGAATATRWASLGEHGGHLPLGGAVDARVGPALLPVIEVGLSFCQSLEAQALQRCSLRMTDAGFNFAFAVGILNAAGHGHRAVVREH